MLNKLLFRNILTVFTVIFGGGKFKGSKILAIHGLWLWASAKCLVYVRLIMVERRSKCSSGLALPSSYLWEMLSKHGKVEHWVRRECRWFYYFGAKVAEVQNSSKIYFSGRCFCLQPPLSFSVFLSLTHTPTPTHTHSHSLSLTRIHTLGLLSLDHPPLLFVLHFRQKIDQCKVKANENEKKKTATHKKLF